MKEIKTEEWESDSEIELALKTVLFDVAKHSVELNGRMGNLCRRTKNYVCMMCSLWILEKQQNKHTHTCIRRQYREKYLFRKERCAYTTCMHNTTALFGYRMGIEVAELSNGNWMAQRRYGEHTTEEWNVHSTQTHTDVRMYSAAWLGTWMNVARLRLVQW